MVSYEQERTTVDENLEAETSDAEQTAVPETEVLTEETDLASEACDTRLKAAEATITSLQDKLLRAAAEVENIRRRSQKDKEDAVKYGNASLAKDILGFIDNLERALQVTSLPTELTPEHKALLDGLTLINRDILAALERHGIYKVKSDGQPFDPALHQAVAEAPAGDGPVGVVHQTLQTGYTLHGRLLRAAMVVVTK